MDLNFGVSVPENEAGPSAFIDAAGRSGNELLFYRFTAPGRVSNQAEAGKYIDNRWNEHWAAGAMLGRFQGRVSAVHIFVWPIKGEPIAAYDGGIAYIWRRISNKQEKILSAYARFQTGDVSPNPGFHCRDCLVSDICRVGQR
jgi:hypothetical protein